MSNHQDEWLDAMRERHPEPLADPSDLEGEAVTRMEDAGCRVRFDVMPDGRYRVRVRKLDGRRAVYNAMTTSTSSYPVLGAYEKFEGWLREGTT